MPKLLIFENAKGTWLFIIFGTDQNENRMHVHVGRKATNHYCKIWLEPDVEVAAGGDLSHSELVEVVGLVKEYKSELVAQWKAFMDGKLKMITIRK